MATLKVSKVSWEELREPFAKVYSGDVERLEVTISNTQPPYVVKIYSVGNHTVRMDFNVKEVRKETQRIRERKVF